MIQETDLEQLFDEILEALKDADIARAEAENQLARVYGAYFRRYKLRREA
ncbi:MAG: hypothetical protein HC913_19105 [Microscillaceae bacterium]|nr:hypothetical protein [Microscillaceae bacterium]